MNHAHLGYTKVKAYSDCSECLKEGTNTSDFCVLAIISMIRWSLLWTIAWTLPLVTIMHIKGCLIHAHTKCIILCACHSAPGQSGYATPGATREVPIIKMEHVFWRWLHLSQRIIDRYPSRTNSLTFWKSGTNPLANKFRRNKFADRNKFSVTPVFSGLDSGIKRE